MADLKELSSTKSFGGYLKSFSHASVACKCPMKFCIYIPPGAEGAVSKFPVVYYMLGLTTVPEVFITELGFQRYAAEHKVVVVAPDVSPRDTGIPGESDDNIYYGHAAGWYMDAMTPGWSDHYNMFSYVTEELIDVIENNFTFVKPGRRSIMGHSMGGHGALLCTLKRPDLYLSTSCLAPASNASATENIIPAYEKYLGDSKEIWKEWDPSELMKSYQGPSLNIMVDVGSRDEFWDTLKIWQLVKAMHGKDNINLDLKVLGGYDHMYNYVATVIPNHIEYHAKILNQ